MSINNTRLTTSERDILRPLGIQLRLFDDSVHDNTINGALMPRSLEVPCLLIANIVPFVNTHGICLS